MTRTLLAVAFLVGLGTAIGQFPPPLPTTPTRQTARTADSPQHPKSADEKALTAVGLKPDDPGPLLDYLRLRTLSPTDLGRIRGVIRRFAEDDFDERLKAATEAERFGPAAVGPLKAAESDPDPEVAYRATETLRRLEKVPHAAISLAAVRALGRLQPPDAAGVLLRFLPMADDDTVTEAIRTALVALAVQGGRPNPALLAGLTDANPACRAAAGVALIEGGPTGSRVHIPDALPKVWAAARAESDPDTKFQLVYALLTVAREKTAVAAVIDMIPELPRGRLWQAEDFLLQLAGPNAPKVVLGKTRDSLTKARTAWKAWWDGAAAGVDVAAFRYEPRVTGRTLLVLADLKIPRGDGTVLELGPDMKERWKIVGLSMPTDARILADGTVAVAEQNADGVTIRETDGRTVARRTPGGPNRIRGVTQLQALPNGNILLVGSNAVVELKKDSDDVVLQYMRTQQHDILSARRLPDGTTAVLLRTANTPFNCLFLDADGKVKTDRRLTVGAPHYIGAVLDVPGPNRLLVTEQGKVTEYDLGTGKSVWDYTPGGQPRSVQRLPNGNTLMVVDGDRGSFGDRSDPGRLVEVTPAGDEVWTYQLEGKVGGLVLAKAYRR